MVNELRLAYTRADFSGQLSPQYDVNSGQNLSLEYGLPSLTKGGLPLINIYDNTSSVANIGSQVSTLGTSLEQQYQIADNIYITKGASTWKFGVDLSRALLNAESLYSIAGGNYQFRFVQTDNNGTGGTQATIGGNPVASFLLGVPNSVVLANTAIPYYYRWAAGAAYIQNDWKIRPNLTLNIGVRYSLQLPPQRAQQPARLPRSRHWRKPFQLSTPCQLAELQRPRPRPPGFPSSRRLRRSRSRSPATAAARPISPRFAGWISSPRFGFAYTPPIPGTELLGRTRRVRYFPCPADRPEPQPGSELYDRRGKL